MPDTGPPWNIPYVEPTDNPRVYPQASEDLADAIADGLDAAGGLVAVKHVLKTDTFSASLSAGANTTVTGLSITHTLADASNKLIINAYFGAVANTNGDAGVGLAIADGSTLIGVGDAASSRTSAGAGGVYWPSTPNNAVGVPSVVFVYEPGDAVSHTYTVRAVNLVTDTRTVLINRSQVDTDAAGLPRTASALVIQEVKV
jgi:hypothetical protein